MSEASTNIRHIFGRQRRLRQRVCDQRNRLYRIAWSWCHDRYLADDLVQETLVRGLAKLDKLREENRLEVWLTQILANLYRDHFRKTKEETGLDIDLGIEEKTPEEHTDRSQLVHRTRAAVARLKEDQRQIITLVDLSGFSYTDTANILGIPVGTVMSRLSRSRSKLRELLEQQDSEDNKVIPLRKI